MKPERSKSFMPRPRKRVGEKFWWDVGVLNNELKDKSAAVHEGFDLKVYDRLKIKWGISQNEFQSATHIPMSTLKRRVRNKERFSQQESDTIYRLLCIIQQATELFESREVAMNWMKKDVRGLGYKKPIDMISTTVDFQKVKNLIGRLEHGVIT